MVDPHAFSTIGPSEDEKMLTFIIHGHPKGKPRMTRSDKWNQRKCVVEYRSWSDRCREEFYAAGGWPERNGEKMNIVVVSWTAHIMVTPSWSKKKKDRMIGKSHQLKPDRDNIDKAVLDSIFKGVEGKDDCEVAHGSMSKLWTNIDPRVVVTMIFN